MGWACGSDSRSESGDRSRQACTSSNTTKRNAAGRGRGDARWVVLEETGRENGRREASVLGGSSVVGGSSV